MQVNIRIIFKIDIKCACNTPITLDITYSLGLFPNQLSVEKPRNKYTKILKYREKIQMPFEISGIFYVRPLTMMDQSACARTYYFVLRDCKRFRR